MYGYSEVLRRLRGSYAATPISNATCPECGSTYVQCIESDECPECGQCSHELSDVPYTELDFC